MSLSARTPSGAVTYYFIPKLYSQKVVDALKGELVAWDAIDSSWESDLVRGDTLYISKTNVVTATEVVVGTKAASLDPFATAGVTLSIDQWYEAPVDIDTMTSRQTHIQMEEGAKTEAAYAIKVKIDTSVCALFSTLGGSTYPNSDGDPLDDDTLLELVETLNRNDVKNDGKRSLILDPSALTDMMKYDKFVAAQYVNIGRVQNGVIGTSPIYGCKVRVTNNLADATTGSYGALIHPRAIGGAAQIDKSWMKPFEELHQIRYQAEALWGVVEVDDVCGKAFYTRRKSS